MLSSKLTATLCLLLAAVHASSDTDDETERNFQDYMARHGKSYPDSDEYQQRMQLWLETENFVNEANQANASFQLGHNQLSDMTPEERKRRCGYKPQQPHMYRAQQSYQELSEAELPDQVDWRDKGVVNPVKDQGQCGSCWAFSAVGALESAYAIKTGKLESISEQQLVDCDKKSDGCNGGTQESAFAYYTRFHAEPETAYKYTAEDGDCSFDKSKVSKLADSSQSNVRPNSAAQLKAALAKQPISVAIEADKPIFQHYASGVFDSADCGTELDHAVLLVGYGLDGETGQEYWIMRNSWGTVWGDQGYMRMAIQGDGDGVCGVQKAPLYPII